MEVLFLIVGLLIGGVFTASMSRERSIGTLWVDKSYPDEQPSIYLQLYEDVGNVSTQKHVRLKVETVKRDNSQK